tara:strand:- start:1137 stop:1916 length:780 start_codon:yes stop_codon:yes gene_type:complete
MAHIACLKGHYKHKAFSLPLRSLFGSVYNLGFVCKFIAATGGATLLSLLVLSAALGVSKAASMFAVTMVGFGMVLLYLSIAAGQEEGVEDLNKAVNKGTSEQVVDKLVSSKLQTAEYGWVGLLGSLLLCFSGLYMMFDVSQIAGATSLTGALAGFRFCWKEWRSAVHIVDAKDVVISIEEAPEGYAMFFGDKDAIMVMDPEEMKEHINNFGRRGEGKMDMVDSWLRKQRLVAEGKVDEAMALSPATDCTTADKDADKSA